MQSNELSNKSRSILKYMTLILSICFTAFIIYIAEKPYGSINFRPISVYSVLLNQSESGNKSKLPTRTLVVYVYGKTHELAQENLEYFIYTAINSTHDADYYIILQQINNVTVDEKQLPILPSNAHYLQHENRCFDIGTVGLFLTTNIHDRTKYKYFIFLNSSIRGPFIVSYYDSDIWYTIFTRRLNDQIKLVGCTINCEVFPHVQSYLWALDLQGLNLLLNDTTVLACYTDIGGTIHRSEIGASRVIINAGFGIDCLMKKYQNVDFRVEENRRCNNITNPTYANVDGLSLDPFEVVFVKIKESFPQYKQNRERVGTYEKWVHKGGKNYSKLDSINENERASSKN